VVVGGSAEYGSGYQGVFTLLHGVQHGDRPVYQNEAGLYLSFLPEYGDWGIDVEYTSGMWTIASWAHDLALCPTEAEDWRDHADCVPCTISVRRWPIAPPAPPPTAMPTSMPTGAPTARAPCAEQYFVSGATAKYTDVATVDAYQGLFSFSEERNGMPMYQNSAGFYLYYYELYTLWVVDASYLTSGWLLVNWGGQKAHCPDMAGTWQDAVCINDRSTCAISVVAYSPPTTAPTAAGDTPSPTASPTATPRCAEQVVLEGSRYISGIFTRVPDLMSNERPVYTPVREVLNAPAPAPALPCPRSAPVTLHA